MKDLVYEHERPLFVISLVISILAWLLLLLGTFGVALVYAPFVFLVYVFTQSAFIAHIKGTAVKLTPRQFPDLYERLSACCAKLGISPIPDCYLLNGQGLFNAFATRFLGRNFVVLLSDLVDAMESRGGGINFYIGHELGHIHRQHLLWQPVLLPASILPLLGAAYHRSREWTCDQYGAACCEQPEDAVAGLTALAAGSKRWQQLAVGEYLAQTREAGGFWMSFHELVSDYPWLVKRVARVVAPEAGANAHVPARHPLAYFFALFVPRGFLGGGGGGLGAVLMAMAVILIIAAIAIPSLLRARMAANEAAAVADLRLIAAAEESCLAAAGHYTTVECLARPADCPALAHVPGAAPLDVGLVSEGPRRGYTRRFLAGPPVTSADGALRSPLALTSYACVAEPVVPGNTGSRAFCIDGTGVIRYSVDGKAQEAGDGSCPRRWPVATTH